MGKEAITALLISLAADPDKARAFHSSKNERQAILDGTEGLDAEEKRMLLDAEHQSASIDRAMKNNQHSLSSERLKLTVTVDLEK